jgi:hypothetical protein
VSAEIDEFEEYERSERELRSLAEEMPERIYELTPKELRRAARRARKAEAQRERRAAIKAELQSRPRSEEGTELPHPLTGFRLSDGLTFAQKRAGEAKVWSLISPLGRRLRPIRSWHQDQDAECNLRWLVRVAGKRQSWTLRNLWGLLKADGGVQKPMVPKLRQPPLFASPRTLVSLSLD